MKLSLHRGVRTWRAFTLIEIMIVIGIAAMIMCMGVPLAFSMLKKDPMRQAVSDLFEACAEARAHAIISGYPTELIFAPRENSFHIGMASLDADSGLVADGGRGHAPPPNFSRQYSDELVLEMLSVNFQELKDEDSARVRFFPNGTSDEFTIVLQWPRAQAFRKISLDIITGLADVEVIR
jgi:prepilin-type N-terminal cleavage/methylation domain-containing protein